MSRAASLCGLALILAGCTLVGQVKPTPAGLPRMPSGTYTMMHKGLARKYILHLPKGREYDDRLALIVAMHGAPGTAKNLEENSLLSQKADAAGFIVVYPDGTSFGDPKFPEWNYWNCCTYTGERGANEVAFIRNLVEHLTREYKIDRRRVYATGYSRGGMMAQLLACDASDLFTGIADIAGALNFEECKPKHPVDVLIVHGRNDNNVKFGGAMPKKLLPLAQGEDRPVAYSVHLWKKHNHCRTGKTITRGNVEYTDYSCARGALRLIALNNEGHTWPGSLPGMLGSERPTPEISANDEMWSFWTKARRRRREKAGNKSAFSGDGHAALPSH
ncbi:MAG: prolyl oligopeptidase family serine peptidase [Spirochaetes bacterium]|nr:prolyl oligopeptidase family serine peptidase [Spirochaetota bacterium]MBX3721466.1 prolyl oligopeptidase family serine peptidase [Turneriella sp.]